MTHASHRHPRAVLFTLTMALLFCLYRHALVEAGPESTGAVGVTRLDRMGVPQQGSLSASLRPFIWQLGMAVCIGKRGGGVKKAMAVSHGMALQVLAAKVLPDIHWLASLPTLWSVARASASCPKSCAWNTRGKADVSCPPWASLRWSDACVSPSAMAWRKGSTPRL